MHPSRASIYVSQPALAPPVVSPTQGASIRVSWRSHRFRILRRKSSTRYPVNHRLSVCKVGEGSFSASNPANVKHKLKPSTSTGTFIQVNAKRGPSLSRRFLSYPARALKSFRQGYAQERSKQRVSQDLTKFIFPQGSRHSMQFACRGQRHVRRARFTKSVVKPHQVTGRSLQDRQHGVVIHTGARFGRKLGKSKKVDEESRSLVFPPLSTLHPRAKSSQACTRCHYSTRLCLCDATPLGKVRLGSIVYKGPGSQSISAPGSLTSLASSARSHETVPDLLTGPQTIKTSHHVLTDTASATDLLSVAPVTPSSDTWTDITWSTDADGTVGVLSVSQSSSGEIDTALAPKSRQSKLRRMPGCGSLAHKGPDHTSAQTTQECETSIVCSSASNDSVFESFVTKATQNAGFLTAPNLPHTRASGSLSHDSSSSALASSCSSLSSLRTALRDSQTVTYDSDVAAYLADADDNWLEAPPRECHTATHTLSATFSHSTIPSLWSRGSFDADASGNLTSPATSPGALSDPFATVSSPTGFDLSCASDRTVVGDPLATDDRTVSSLTSDQRPHESKENDRSTPQDPLASISQGSIGLGLELPALATLPEILRDRRESTHDGIQDQEDAFVRQSHLSGSAMTFSSSRRWSSVATTLDGKTTKLDDLLEEIADWTRTQGGTIRILRADSGDKASPNTTPTRTPLCVLAGQDRDSTRCDRAFGRSERDVASWGSMGSSSSFGAELSSSALLHHLSSASTQTASSDWVESNQNKQCQDDLMTIGPLALWQAQHERRNANPFSDDTPTIDVSPLLCPSISFDSDVGEAPVDGRHVRASSGHGICGRRPVPYSLPDEIDSRTWLLSPDKNSTLPVPQGDELQETSPDLSSSDSWLDNFSTGTTNSAKAPRRRGLQFSPSLLAVSPLALSSSSQSFTIPDDKATSTSVPEDNPATEYVPLLLNEEDQGSRTPYDLTPYLDSPALADRSPDFSDAHLEESPSLVQKSRHQRMGQSQAAPSSRLMVVGETESGQKMKSDLLPPGKDYLPTAATPIAELILSQRAAAIRHRPLPEVPQTPSSPEEVPRRRGGGQRRTRRRRKLSVIWTDGPESSYCSPTAEMLIEYMSEGSE